MFTAHGDNMLYSQHEGKLLGTTPARRFLELSSQNVPAAADNWHRDTIFHKMEQAPHGAAS